MTVSNMQYMHCVSFPYQVKALPARWIRPLMVSWLIDQALWVEIAYNLKKNIILCLTSLEYKKHFFHVPDPPECLGETVQDFRGKLVLHKYLVVYVCVTMLLHSHHISLEMDGCDIVLHQSKLRSDTRTNLLTQIKKKVGPIV